MWMTVQQFKDDTKICGLTDTQIENLLKIGYQQAKSYIFNKILVKMNTLQRDTTHYLKLQLHGQFIQDYFSYDGTVDENDINVYLLDRQTYEETDVSDKITVFRPKYGYIEFSEQLPQANVGTKELYIEYYLGRFEFAEVKERIYKLQLLMGLREMLNDKPMAAAVSMTSSWSHNGLTFDSGAATTNTFYENITMSINKLIFDLQPLRIQSRDIVQYDNPFLASKF